MGTRIGQVTCTSTDSSSNSKSCTFNVKVTPSCIYTKSLSLVDLQDNVLVADIADNFQLDINTYPWGTFTLR